MFSCCFRPPTTDATDPAALKNNGASYGVATAAEDTPPPPVQPVRPNPPLTRRSSSHQSQVSRNSSQQSQAPMQALPEQQEEDESFRVLRSVTYTIYYQHTHNPPTCAPSPPPLIHTSTHTYIHTATKNSKPSSEALPLQKKKKPPQTKNGKHT